MKAKELRIGNFIKLKDSDIEANVECISYAMVQLQGNMVQNRLEQVEGIQINEKWLKLFGFKKQHDYGCSNLWSKKTPQGEYFNIFEQPTGVRDGSRSSGIWVIQSGHMGYKHVHQLQNLYKALTGEDLQLKN